MHRKS